MNELKCPQCGGNRMTQMTDGYYKCQYCRAMFKPEHPTEPVDNKQEQQQVVVNVTVPNTEPFRQSPTTGVFHSGYQEPSRRSNGKSRGTAIVLCFFLGMLGIHQFYIGNAGRGILYLLFCWTIWPVLIAAVIDLIILATMSDVIFDEKYNYR